MLDTTKDDYRNKEKRNFFIAKIVMVVQVIYDSFKVLLLTITYMSCSTKEACSRSINRDVTWFLFFDIIESALIWLYAIYLFINCFRLMNRYSKFEYEKHKVPMSFNFLGLFLCFPLFMWGKYIWLTRFTTYLELRRPYYLMFFSTVLPAVAFIFTRLDHDCFNCFNRITPTRYSIFQYS